MKKIIYIFERRHHYNYDGEMFFINQFVQAGYEVEVWSLVYWTFGNKVEKPLNMDTTGRGIYINNKTEFDNQIERVKSDNCIFVCYPYHAYTEISAYIRKKIKESGFKFCNLCESPVFKGLEKGIKDNKIFLLVIEELKYIGYYLKKRLSKEKISYLEHLYPLIYKSSYNILCVEGNYRTFPNKMEIFAKRNIIIHSDDYSRLIEEDTSFNYGKKFIVFVDQYITGHSDFRKCNKPFPITNKEKYFKECNDFFSKIEKKYGCEVIIAAHPKAEYKGDEFGKRQIVYGKTVQLLSKAELVLIMTSTTYGMVCFYEKPFIIISSEQMVDGVMWEEVCRYSNFFDKKILIMNDLTKTEEISNYIVYPNAKYKKLVERMVISKRGIRNKKFYEVMLEIFNNMFYDEVKGC